MLELLGSFRNSCFDEVLSAGELLKVKKIEKNNTSLLSVKKISQVFEERNIYFS